MLIEHWIERSINAQKRGEKTVAITAGTSSSTELHINQLKFASTSILIEVEAYLINNSNECLEGMNNKNWKSDKVS